MGGYGVSPEMLRQTAKGINDAISELKALGIAESGEIGRGFSGVSLRGMQVGHQGLEKAFSNFCERWSWGVRTLVQDGSEIAARLHLSAGEYYDAERYLSGTFKDLTNDVAGDPHKSDDEVEQGSWGDIAKDSALHPDYSAESWEKTGHDASQTWRTEARDLAEGQYGLGRKAADAAGYGDSYDRMGDAIFGSNTRNGGNG